MPHPPGSLDSYFLQDSQRKVIYQIKTIPSVQQRTPATTTYKAVRRTCIQTLTKNHHVRNYKITKNIHITYIITASVSMTADMIPHWMTCKLYQLLSLRRPKRFSTGCTVHYWTSASVSKTADKIPHWIKCKPYQLSSKTANMIPHTGQNNQLLSPWRLKNKNIFEP